jgi:hypothetical protein
LSHIRLMIASRHARLLMNLRFNESLMSETTGR